MMMMTTIAVLVRMVGNDKFEEDEEESEVIS